MLTSEAGASTATSHPPDEQAKETFLSLFEVPRRSFISNLFLHQVRSGLTDRFQIVQNVKYVLERKIAKGYQPERDREIYATIAANVNAALHFAAWAVDYENAPAEYRNENRRTQQEEHIRRWLTNQPPSEKQIAYLRSLGYSGGVASRFHACELITLFVKQQQQRKGVRRNG